MNLLKRKKDDKIEEKGPKFSYTYESLINLIIRPPRANYKSDDLSKSVINYENIKWRRTEYTIINKQNKKLKCSFFEQKPKNRLFEKMPVIVYLHGNSSSRIEGIAYVPLLLKNNINVFLFDFSGSGLSEGDYITLGYNEKEDVECVINFVSKLKGVGKIGIWGRSMGASTALMYIHKDERIKACVIDSPFSDFTSLAKHLCQTSIGIPDLLFRFAYYFVKNSIEKKCGFNIEEIKPIQYAEKCHTPAFFIHAKDDELIPLEHTVNIYEKYIGTKTLNVCNGGHNTLRDNILLNKVVDFFNRFLYDS